MEGVRNLLGHILKSLIDFFLRFLGNSAVRLENFKHVTVAEEVEEPKVAEDGAEPQEMDCPYSQGKEKKQVLVLIWHFGLINASLFCG